MFREFKYLLFLDQKKRLKEKSIDCEIIDISEIKKIDEKTYHLFDVFVSCFLSILDDFWWLLGGKLAPESPQEAI